MLTPIALLMAAGLPATHGGQASRQEPLGKAATQALVVRYRSADHWVLKGIVLLSLGRSWHPVGSEMIVEALRSSDKRLRAYAIEALARTSAEALPSAVSKRLLADLITVQLNENNSHYHNRVLEVLKKIAPAAAADSRLEWSIWWRKVRGEYTPPEWVPPVHKNKKAGGGTVTQPFIDRAFDLKEAGLDLVICIDSTGSMQPIIDLARDSLGEIILMLGGITTKLRLGLVHYRDYEEYQGFTEGAKLLAPLTKKVKGIRDTLAGLKAAGGGDIPERVEKGLEIAFSEQLLWKKEANKVVVVIGDSPPHPEAVETARALAEAAYKNPFQRPDVPTTGVRSKAIRPFVTSAICVGANPDTEEAFKKIAKAGGGAYGRIPVPGNPDYEKEKGKGKGDASRKIVKHILTLAFGAGFAAEMEALVEIFYTYRNAKLFD